MRQLQLNPPAGPDPKTDFAAFDFKAAFAWIAARNQFSMKLGLDTMRALLQALGNPQAGLNILHVAGTNGKGSVCGNLAALLQASGCKRVGLYTSPHLVSFRERIRIDGEPMPRAALLDFLRQYGPVCENLGATYFEIATALALQYFREQNCEAVVLETGLGGRLDATNVCLPQITAITPVDYDHMAQLGPTLPQIFAEKAAILKPGIPMVLARQHAELEPSVAALRQTAASQGSQLIEAEQFPWHIEGETWVLPGQMQTWRLPASLRPEKHQSENLALALLAFEAWLMRSGAKTKAPTLSPEALIAALTKSLPAGRTQILQKPGRLPLILDGAHNPHGLRALQQTLQKRYPGKRLRVIFAMMADKPVTEALNLVGGFATELRFAPLWLTYARAWQPANPIPDGEPLLLQDLAPEALRASLAENSGADAVVVCGSLYLLGEVMAALCGDYPELSEFVALSEDRSGLKAHHV